MAKINIPSLKSKFESGDRPTGADYADLIDTLAAQATDLGTDGNNENTIYGIENYTVIETLDATAWRLLKYDVSILKNTDGDNKYYSTHINVLIDAEDIYVSEYGIIDNDGDMGTVTVSRSGDTLTLSVTPISSVRPITVRYMRTGLKA